jgi:hypothetical protein
MSESNGPTLPNAEAVFQDCRERTKETIEAGDCGAAKLYGISRM